jgi:SnoaL-like protein
VNVSAQEWVDLHQLVTRYSKGLDSRDYDLVRSVWAPDPHISYDLSTVGVEKDLLTYHSAEDMVRDAQHIHAPLAVTMHQNHNYYFEVDGDRATGRVYVDLFEVRVDDGTSQTVHHLGWYDDEYVRVGGEWKIKQRHFTIRWSEGDWIGDRPSAETSPARA